MEKSFGLLFFLRRSQSAKTEQSKVYMRITVDGESVEVSIKRFCDQLLVD
jgi:hypothetical protein